MNIPNIYKPFAGIVFLFILISILNIPILVTLWRHSFDDGTYSHAYLIPFIVIYLYFKLSEVGLLVFREKTSLLANGILIFSGVLLFITSNAQISIGYWLSLLTVILSAIMTLFRFNLYVIFPALFLIFIFPLWGLLTDFLQSTSVMAVTYMMSFTGIPTYVEAQFITIPAGVFEIADGCSGLRYIIVSLAISSLFIFLYINNAKKALIFLSIAIVGALFTNWIRITALILIGEYTQMQSSLMEDHNTFGWYLYIPFMFLLFVWGNKLTTIDLFNIKPNLHIKFLLPTKINIALIFVSLVVFSTSAKYFLSNENNTTNQTEYPSLLKPIVFHATSSTVSTSFLGQDIKQITYVFAGEDLDGKPTYFANTLIPADWAHNNQYIINNWNVNIISKRGRNALILFQYEIAGEKSPTARQFKIARLLNALQGERHSKLHWMHVPCKTNCKFELKNLEKVN